MMLIAVKSGVFGSFFLAALFLCQEKNEEFLPPVELRGKEYAPKIRASGGLANWDQMDLTNEGISKVRLFGFRNYNSGRNLDLLITDPEEVKLIASGLHPSMCFRPVVADFSRARASTGQGGFVGVIQLMGDNQNYIVGVGHNGFFWGVYHGNSHQIFYSLAAAKMVKHWVREHGTKEVSQELLKRLSGESKFEDAKAMYAEFEK